MLAPVPLRERNTQSKSHRVTGIVGRNKGGLTAVIPGVGSVWFEREHCHDPWTVPVPILKPPQPSGIFVEDVRVWEVGKDGKCVRVELDATGGTYKTMKTRTVRLTLHGGRPRR